MIFTKKGGKEIFSKAAITKITEYVGNKDKLGELLPKGQ